ncbi:MAG: hypothetical protein ABIO70_12385, partial [Pseudomonadota bacterium]
MAVTHKQVREHKKFSLVSLLVYLLPVVLVYLGIVYIPAWWTDRDVNSVLREYASKAYKEKDEEVLRKGIVERLGRLGIEVKEKSLKVRLKKPDL